MATDTTNAKQPSNSLSMATPSVKLPPEVLKAAKRGDWSKLGNFVREEAIVDIDGEPAVKRTHTSVRLDLVLHAVASGGDSDKFLMCATAVYSKAKNLLATGDADGNTPFHCAARSGSVKMLSHLIALASGASSLQVALRKPNNQGETALHEAVRWKDKEMVDVLMSADAELARFPCNDGASPLYLAILLGHDDIAEQLHDKDNQLSYSGPDGQNALHVAVLRSERMTRQLLAWNKDLTKKGDRPNGRTPLHYAASWDNYDDIKVGPVTVFTRQAIKRASLILEADESSAYQSDNEGLFPIHAAALGSNFDVFRILLQKCPDCAQLRDGKGRTFLHIAISEGSYAFREIYYRLSEEARLFSEDTCKVRRFASILNAQDNEGNTALHLAAAAGQDLTTARLIMIKEVQLNLQNKKGQTALDLSLRTKPPVFYVLDPHIRTYKLLLSAGAKFGVHQDGKKEQPPAGDMLKKMEGSIKETTTVIGVVSVLVITASFAAAFQLPGGYSTGNKPAGTPELAKKYSFQAFLVANNLAFFCSALSIISLMYAGLSFVDLRSRMIASLISIFFLNSSLRSLLAAFTFGTYAVLAPVAHATTVLAWLSMGLVLGDIAWFANQISWDLFVLGSRKKRALPYLIISALIITILFYALWPYVVIAGFMAYWKICGIK